jgi:hypothetical protein
MFYWRYIVDKIASLPIKSMLPIQKMLLLSQGVKHEYHDFLFRVLYE